MLGRKINRQMEKKSTFLRKNKEILDIKLWSVLEVLVIAEKNNPWTLVTILLKSQKILRAIILFFTSQKNRFWRSWVYKMTEKL